MNHNVLNPECPQNNGMTAACLCQTVILQEPAPKESLQENWEQKMFEAGKVLGRKEEREKVLRWAKKKKVFFEQALAGTTDSSYYAEGCVRTIEDLFDFLLLSQYWR